MQELIDRALVALQELQSEYAHKERQLVQLTTQIETLKNRAALPVESLNGNDKGGRHTGLREKVTELIRQHGPLSAAKIKDLLDAEGFPSGTRQSRNVMLARYFTREVTVETNPKGKAVERSAWKLKEGE